ncbi:MAG: putative protoporphyrinogen oxidase [Chlamydiota bacterium]|jgi:oxygen-dependent protoporphyrinogen oxidase
MKILILGGGISGLAAGWYARKKYPRASITLLEKAPDLGGCLAWGPRIFPYHRSPHLLQLIEELGLTQEIVGPITGNRYVLHNGKLKSLMRVALPFLPRMCLEPFFVSDAAAKDESVAMWGRRRFGGGALNRMIDPFCLGIYGTAPETLSVQMAFPLFAGKASVVRALLGKRQKGGLFALRGGMRQLVDALVKRLDIEIVCNAEITHIERGQVIANERLYKADEIISALPLKALARLASAWPHCASVPLWVVTMQMDRRLVPPGFGYLVPSAAKRDLLGMIFHDSELIAMVRGHLSQSEAKACALHALTQDLSIQHAPSCLHIVLAQDTLPHFYVGYLNDLRLFQQHVKEKFNFTLLGNYLEGPSVDTCIKLVQNLFRN